jgi:hypothetical protein
MPGFAAFDAGDDLFLFVESAGDPLADTFAAEAAPFDWGDTGYQAQYHVDLFL